MAFIPESDKIFPYIEGNIILARNEGKNTFSLIKLLKKEKAMMEKGVTRNIAGMLIEAPEDDFFLIIAVKMTDLTYTTMEEAKENVKKGEIPWKFLHLPMRPSSWQNENLELVGDQDVTEEELVLYNEWKNLFDKGEAGVW